MTEETVVYNPVRSAERIELIDTLRGFALFGILMVNMLYMYAPMSSVLTGVKSDASTSHILAESFIKFFFEGKFYVIFSLLFGFGFWLFMNKKKEDGGSALPLFRRRLLWLLLFGVAHVTLLWVGDILFFYAIIGFLLILFRKSSDRKIIRWAVVTALIPTVLTILFVGLFMLAGLSPEGREAVETQTADSLLAMDSLVDRASHTYATGSFGEIVAMRIEEFMALLFGSLFFFVPVVLAMFLMGFLLARKGLVTRYQDNLPLFRRLFWWGLVVGVVTSAIYTISYYNTVRSVMNMWALLATTMHTLGGISLGLCYVSGITILFIKGRSGWMVRNLSPVGRMALTNYLSHSLITALLFHSYGLGLYGKVEVWQGILLAVVIFSLQILLSRWWLSRYRFGPLEWLWRSLTYWKVLANARC